MLIPCMIYILISSFKKAPHYKCACRQCASKKPKRNITNLILTSIIVIIFAYLCKNILTIKLRKRTESFDPFIVLDISPEASISEIKKSHRKLLRKFSKNLKKEGMKEEAAENIKNITKALTILKSPDSLKSWISNDTTKELLVALPAFLLNFRSSFLFVYAIIVLLTIPLFFVVKQFSTKKTSFSGSLYESNEKFYKEVDQFSEVHSISLHQCILLIGKSIEFKEKRWVEELPLNMVKEIEMEYAIPVMNECEGYQRLLQYLIRGVENASDREYTRLTSIKLIESFKRIALLKEKSKAFEVLLILEKMINQAVFNPDYFLLQYPGLKLKEVYNAMLSKGEKFTQVELEKRLLKELLSGESLEIAMRVFDRIPRITIKSVKAFTIDTSIDSCKFDKENTKICKMEGETFLIPKDSLPFIQLELFSESSNKVCHIPYSLEPVFNKWIIYLKINDCIHENVVVLDDFKGSKKVIMELALFNTKQTVKTFVVSNGYFGNDLSSQLTIKSY
ncbi:hypothetical protein GINT2_001284 [Glugoides intestinalis]